MKTEGEFGFEPSLLVEMAIEQNLEEKGPRMVNSATVLKDRFGKINLQTCANPTFEFFRPHVERLRPGTHHTIDTESRTRTEVEAEGGDSGGVDRSIQLERIENALTKTFPATSGRDRSMKLLALEQVFGTSAWTQISRRTSIGQLRRGAQDIEALTTKAREAAENGLPLEEVIHGKAGEQASGEITSVAA